jgi:hypothetical protein
VWTLTVLMTLAVFAGMGPPGTCDEPASGSPPPVVYTLEINGQVHQIRADEPLKLTGSFTDPVVTLRVASTRTLSHAGVQFDYPANFTFESETEDPDFQSWTVSGNDVTVMVFLSQGELTPQALAQSTAEALKVTDYQMKPAQLKLGSQELSGTSIRMSLGEVAILQQVLQLPPQGTRSRLLVIQDTLSGPDSRPSPEATHVLEVLRSTFQLTP